MRTFVPPLGRAGQGFAFALTVCALAFGFALAVTEGLDDWLYISGWLALLLGLLMAQFLPTRLEHTLGRLTDRGVLTATPEQLAGLKTKLEILAQRWGPACGLLLAGSIFLSFAISSQLYKISLIVGEVFGGYIAGCYLARMVVYGLLGWLISRAGIGLQIIPGHLDLVAGLKPVGDFYLRQSVVAGIPALFIATWLMLIPLPQFQMRYQQWMRPYQGLLVLAVVFEVLSFAVPLWWFHRRMTQQKQDLLKEADKLSAEVASLQRELSGEQSPENMSILKDKIEHKTLRYVLINKIPTWPIDIQIKTVFGVSNFALFLPLIGDYLGMSKLWTDFAKDLLQKIGGH
jgi:hypothetical protein